MEAWGLYVTGLQPQEKELEMVAHASGCDACSALLEDSAALSDEPIPAELATLNPERKASLLEKMDGGPIVIPTRRGRSGFAWIRWGAIAAVLVVTLSLGTSSNVALKLLNSGDRESEFRFQGANYAPSNTVRGTRRSESTSGLLAKLLLRIRQPLQRDDAEWLHVRGRIALLDSDLNAAVNDLKLALSTDPKRSDIANDLAVALMEQAGLDTNSVATRVEDTDNAIKVLSDAIDADAKNPVLHFNLALAYESAQIPTKALQEWEAFLSLENSGGWAEEARRHRDALKAAKQARRQRPSSRSEDLILPLAGQQFQASANIDPEKLSRDLADNHSDHWLRDVLAAKASAGDSQAKKTLAEAVHAFSIGDASKGGELAKSARAQFQRAGNNAAAELASFEIAYSFQRLSQPTPCIGAIESALPSAKTAGHAWLVVQLQLTMAACLALQRQFDSSYEALASAQEAARSAHYPNLELRSLGFRSGLMREIGSYRLATEADSQVVQRFWHGEGTINNGYQAYYGLALASWGMHYPAAAAAFLAEAVDLAEAQSDRTMEGMVRARHGEYLLEAGRIHEATDELQRSSDLFRTLPVTPSTTLYGAVAQLSQARVDSRRGDFQPALAKLGQMEEIEANLKNPSIEANLWTLKSQILARAGHLEKSEEPLRRLLQLGDDQRSASPSASDRSALSRQLLEAVNTLTDTYISAGDYTAAWRVWTRYNSCFQTVQPSPDALRIIFTALPSGPVAMIAGSAQVSVIRLPADSGLQPDVQKLRRALADHEDVGRVAHVSSAVYRRVIGPIETQLRDAKSLYIAASGIFAAIPFQALTADDGKWVGQQYRIVYSPPLGGASVSSNASLPGTRLLAVSYGESAHVFGADYARLPDLQTDLTAAEAAFPAANRMVAKNPNAANVERMMAIADVFHYSGHSVVTADDAALLLAPDTSGEHRDRLLWPSRLPRKSLANLKLVVLAACSTGASSDEARFASSNMARTFLLAGVPQVIATAWDVDSAATGQLVQHFYAVLEKKFDPEAALADAAANLRTSGKFADPYYWAAFEVLRR